MTNVLKTMSVADLLNQGRAEHDAQLAAEARFAGLVQACIERNEFRQLPLPERVNRLLGGYKKPSIH